MPKHFPGRGIHQSDLVVTINDNDGIRQSINKWQQTTGSCNELIEFFFGGHGQGTR